MGENYRYRRTMSAEDRLFAQSEPDPFGGCLLWFGCAGTDGYGIISFNSKKTSTHRLSYETFNGPIPDGLIVRHKCDVRACINPNHLLVGTKGDNLVDAYQRNRRIQPAGERCVFATHTAEEARKVKNLTQAGLSVKAIREKTGLDRDFINKVRSGRAWVNA